MHVHLTAPEPVLAERYETRPSEVEELASYEAVRANATEAVVDELAAQADVVIDTARAAEEEVLDALVVDIPQADRSRMTLFVVRREGAEPTPELEAAIRARIREDCSPRHVPDEIRPAPEIPRTLSGKILEVPVKRILMGLPPDQVASRDSLANPDALAWFERFAASDRRLR